MAFTTITGSNGRADSFIGTTGVDRVTLGVIRNGAFLSARQADDVVNLNSGGTGALASFSLNGGAGADTFTSLSSTNISRSRLLSDDGNDLISLAGVDASTVSGGIGNDQISAAGSVASALINGNADIDQISINSGAVSSSIFGGIGDDTLALSTELRRTYARGNEGDDVLTVANGTFLESATVNGNEGNDVITVNAISLFATSTIFGGDGTDTINAANSGVGVVVRGDTGNDSITGGTGTDTLTGDAGNDSITGGGGADSMNVSEGANRITDAGNGADTVVHNVANSTVDIQNTGTGEVDLTASEGGATVTSTDGGTRSVNASTSTAGVTLNAALVGAFAVFYLGGSANDSITGGNGNDFLRGNAGNDIITGGAGDDHINTGSGNNIVNSGSGVDLVIVSAAASGNTNTVNLSGAGNLNRTNIQVTSGDELATTIQSTGTTNDQQARANASTIGVIMNGAAAGVSVNFQGGGGNDQITGNSADDTFSGGNGNDTINGGAGAEAALNGDNGDDLFIYNTGDVGVGERLDGGAGNNAIRVDTSTIFTNLFPLTILTAAQINEIRIDGGQIATFAGTQLTSQAINITDADNTGNATLTVDAVGTTDFAALTFNAGGGTAFAAGADSVIVNGGGGNTVITGTSFGATYNLNGTDTVTAGAGNDTIIAGGGNDCLSGGGGADQINGGSDNDTITGGAGNDNIDGGTGSNVYQPATVLIAGAPGNAPDVQISTGADTIAGFIVANDQFRIDESVFGDMGNGGSGAGAVLNAAQFANVNNVSIDLTGNIAAGGTAPLDVTGNGAIVFARDEGQLYFIEAGAVLSAGGLAAMNVTEIANFATIIARAGVLTNADFDIVA